MKVDLVVTTIFEPAWLAGYLDNLRDYGREDQVTIRILCDRKTPASVYAAAEDARSKGFQIDCPSLQEQVDYLQGLEIPEDFIPWNSDNRRNIGFLRAWEAGADVLISIDDDNYCRNGTDFVGTHLVVGRSAGDGQELRFATGGDWYNICERLDTQLSDPFYARGYPYAARAADRQAGLGPLPTAADNTRIAVNAGLWTKAPDVDAVSRLAQGPLVASALDEPVLLGPDTWSPLNTQNTALIREAIPAYYYVRMGYALGGMTIDRFGDILSGYFLQKCAKHLGHGLRFGPPVAEHRRSPHNLFRDLYHELAGMVMVEELLPWLRELSLEGEDYPQAYATLAAALAEQSDQFKGFIWDQGGREFLRETAECMQIWLTALGRLRGGRA